ncbi:MAG: Ig-like domain-containing protein [Myxococcales bacterium]
MIRRSLVVLTCVLGFGCGSNSGKARATGAVQMLVSATPTEGVTINCVNVTVTGDWTGPGMPAIQHQLFKAPDGTWQGTIFKVPLSGTNPNHFVADAYTSTDCTGAAYENSANVAVTSTAIAFVSIVITLPPPPTGMNNGAPIIDSVTASTLTPEQGAPVTIAVTAHDPDGDAPLTYDFSLTTQPPGAVSTLSTSPGSPTNATFSADTQGAYVVRIIVSDGQGAADEISLPINVGPDTGTAQVTVGFTNSPSIRITGILAADAATATFTGRIQPGQEVFLNVGVTSPAGDPLTYTWDPASCGGQGNFSDYGIPNFKYFTLSADATVTSCALSVIVSDPAGASSAGTLTLTVGGAATIDVAPQITSQFQSFTSVGVGDTVNFDVTAADPKLSPLTFSWSLAGGGTLGDTPGGTANSSSNIWTATTDACTSPPTITVDVSDGLGLHTLVDFTVAVDSGCP